jgi:hypothetical protein
MLKDAKPAVLAAIKASGQAVEWRDEPDQRKPAQMRSEYGSVWSAEADCSAFWAAYEEQSASALHTEPHMIRSGS